MVKILHITSIIIGIIGVVTIVWGVILTTFRLLNIEIKRIKQHSIYHEREIIRHQLGSYLLLGLEFLIAADIIRTVTHPTLEDMAVLGCIVSIRTVISYFLEREVANFSPTRKSKSHK
jgi:uncharacterized membrane protein